MLLLCLLFAAVIGTMIAPAIVSAQEERRDFGDAPEGALAYPSSGVIGAFPTCSPSPYVIHDNFGTWFGPGFDREDDGNAGDCPLFNPNNYDQDECFNDGDAGLIKPEPYTIQGAIGSETVVPCPNSSGSALGNICQTARWGTDIDIQIHNYMPNHEPYLSAYVNVLVDWNQDGQWGGSSACSGGDVAAEHVLVNFMVQAEYDGTLSALVPADFNIGPNSGYVWARFSITESAVKQDWDGQGAFEDGESEDYLLRIDERPVGGVALPVERTGLLLPWLIVAILVAGVIVVVIKKRSA